ncbi:hypothetical protein BD309DRAFT_949568 [Dichomitus squalens]|uniref:Uncharacterized protein n=1 Tax=Dichomitus squalens TaxID=114155 RepID=A0A4Q9MVY2_9APHY|nr:hypothetical protein BD311DRAFT_751317 [Dichomitus squalens]TBU48487.1 hypothetical protein BD309DRAFT_949568 [Dichomitus squalens]
MPCVTLPQSRRAVVLGVSSIQHPARTGACAYTYNVDWLKLLSTSTYCNHITPTDCTRQRLTGCHLQPNGLLTAIFQTSRPLFIRLAFLM